MDQAAGLTHSCGLSAGVGGALSVRVLRPSLSNSNNCVFSAVVYSFISLFGHTSSAFLTLPNEMTAAHAHAARKPSAVTSVTIYTSKYACTHSHSDGEKQSLLMAVSKTWNDGQATQTVSCIWNSNYSVYQLELISAGRIIRMAMNTPTHFCLFVQDVRLSNKTFVHLLNGWHPLGPALCQPLCLF